MIQKDKDLLLKDLCGRLPYGIKVNIPDLFLSTKNNIEVLNEIFCGDDNEFRCNDSGMMIKYVKPYLFPLSTMTEEQEIEYDATFETVVYEDGRKDSVMTYKSFDWLNKNHFDYRGLIPMGLAIDATELDIY